MAVPQCLNQSLSFSAIPSDTLKRMGKQKTSLGCLFWIALILLVLVVFFFNRQRITQVMEETGFSQYLAPEESSEPEVKRKSVNEDDSDEGSTSEEDSRIELETEEEQSQQEEKESEEPAEVTIDKEEKEVEETSGTKEEPKIEKNLRKSTVYFVSVDDEGNISLKQIIRPVYYKNSPLTATINTLLEGLTPAELNEGLLNLIPDNTEIHRIWIENEVAYIDFSEDLRFNPFGIEGIRAALRQIVYTATEFSTVDKVQILINGEKRAYIASEGIPIGTPIGRGELSK